LSAGARLTFVSGETDEPIAGETVRIGSAEYITDAAGQIDLAETVPANSGMTVIARGFFDRNVLLPSSSEPRFTLWPVESPTGLDASWTEELVYSYTCTTDPAWEGRSFPLRRIRSGTSMPITFAPGPLRREVVREAAQTASHIVNNANEGRVVFTPVTDGVSGPRIEIRLADPPGDESYVARMVLDFDRDGYVTGGHIEFPVDPVQRSDWDEISSHLPLSGEGEYLAATITHELGHALGLYHSKGVDHFGLMSRPEDCSGSWTVWQYYYERDFSRGEKLALKLMHQRRAGNTFPDNDKGVRASVAGQSVTVCVVRPPSARAPNPGAGRDRDVEDPG
jgi:hypothetical protein